MSEDRLTVRFEVIEGDYDSTNPLDRIAPRNAKVAVLQTLDDAIEGDRWHVWGGDAGRSFDGYGPTRLEAVLDWLRARMGYPSEEAS